MKKVFLISLIIPLLLAGCSTGEKNVTTKVWTIERANEWYKETGWISGCNFLPSTAVNSIEFWQKETFDPETIDRELGYAEDLGFNTMRVWLNSLVYRDDPEGFKNRVEQYLAIADKHKIKTMFVFFCDCFNRDSKSGPQPAPKPGVHNSQWVQDPSCDLRTDTTALYAWLEKYVKDLIQTYSDDKRVLVWDLYNEPGQVGHDDLSLPLVRKVFQWAREINPSQPVTTGLNKYDHLRGDRAYPLNKFLLENSDIITYHCYKSLPEHGIAMNMFKLYGRPVICTEWMARQFDSKFQNILPVMKANNVGAINWGLVTGKTQTMYKWGEVIPDGSEPPLWFHDILRKDGTPFDQVEIDTIKAINARR